jgi:hypothetical protein
MRNKYPLLLAALTASFGLNPIARAQFISVSADQPMIFIHSASGEWKTKITTTLDGIAAGSSTSTESFKHNWASGGQLISRVEQVLDRRYVTTTKSVWTRGSISPDLRNFYYNQEVFYNGASTGPALPVQSDAILGRYNSGWGYYPLGLLFSELNLTWKKTEVDIWAVGTTTEHSFKKSLQVRLDANGGFGKAKRLVLVRVFPYEAFISPQTPPPFSYSPTTYLATSPTLIPYHQVKVKGEQLNADYTVPLLVKAVPGGPNSFVNITPVVDGVTSFFYHLDVHVPTRVPLSRTYHPGLGSGYPTLAQTQAKFDQASLLMAEDDDDKIPDNDPSVAPPSEYRPRGFFEQWPWTPIGHGQKYFNDDVPLYVEFDIQNSGNGAFPVNHNGVDFTASKYLTIRDRTDMLALARAAFSEIKQVKAMIIPYSLNGPLVKVLGVTEPSTRRIVYRANCDASTLAHEWLHRCGLSHRGFSPEGWTPNPSGGLAGYWPGLIDPSVMEDVGAIMQATGNGSKVNRYERDQIKQALIGVSQ